MSTGYIKLHRKVLDSGIMKNHSLWAFWCWCLIKATHKPYNITVGFREISLIPGQFIFGRRMAAEELCMSERKVRTCLNSLKATSKVTIKTTNRYSIITVINWASYQNTVSLNDHQNDQQNDQQATSRRPAGDHKQEVKKNKNDKKEKKSARGEYRNVLLTDEEYTKLMADYGTTATGQYIVRLDEYIENKGTKYKSHYLTIKSWVRRDKGSNDTPGGSERTIDEQLDRMAKGIYHD